ncbi:MAG: hypothetical protein KDC92_00590 [Bacteroidetes bacterium]|nr:hypothetical protein [Bacteroidota bacterium]
MTEAELRAALQPHTFWDTEIDRIDFDKNARFVIERVYTRADMPEIWAVQKFYGRKKVEEALKQVRCMDHLTLNWVSKSLNIPLEEFRCYEGKPLDRSYLGY